MTKYHTRSKAFSLIEVSVVIIIVGILIAGVTQGTRLIDEARLKTARDLTNNSRINSMEGLVFWYEPTLPASFSKADAVDGAIVDQWNDINPQSSSKLHAYAGQKTDSTKISYNITTGGTAGNTSGPTYIEDGLNHIPTLRFYNTGATGFRYLAVDNEMKNTPQDSMTLFVVATYRSGSGYFIDRVCDNAGVPSACGSSSSAGIPLFLLQYAAGMIIAGIRTDPAVIYSFASASNVLSTGKSYIMTLQRDYNNSLYRLYVNGGAGYTSSADVGAGLTLDSFKIGTHGESAGGTNDVDISEVIFFSGDIKKRDRQEVEKYLGKKYNITVVSN